MFFIEIENSETRGHITEDLDELAYYELPHLFYAVYNWPIVLELANHFKNWFSSRKNVLQIL